MAIRVASGPRSFMTEVHSMSPVPTVYLPEVYSYWLKSDHNAFWEEPDQDQEQKMEFSHDQVMTRSHRNGPNAYLQ